MMVVRVACREIVHECLTTQTNRALVYANRCDTEGHLPLRNTFTTMLLAGIPTKLRLALVTDVPRVWLVAWLRLGAAPAR